MTDLMLGLGDARINLNLPEIEGCKKKTCLKALSCHTSKLAHRHV